MVEKVNVHVHDGYDETLAWNKRLNDIALIYLKMPLMVSITV